MMTSANNGIKKYIFLILSIIIIFSSVLVCYIFFHPKKIDSLVEVNNISEVKLIIIENGEIENNIEKKQFESILVGVTYRKRIRKLKCGNSKYYEIKYNDGSKIILGNYIYEKYNADGKRIDGFLYIIYGELF